MVFIGSKVFYSVIIQYYDGLLVRVNVEQESIGWEKKNGREYLEVMEILEKGYLCRIKSRRAS